MVLQRAAMVPTYMLHHLHGLLKLEPCCPSHAAEGAGQTHLLFDFLLLLLPVSLKRHIISP